MPLAAQLSIFVGLFFFIAAFVLVSDVRKKTKNIRQKEDEERAAEKRMMAYVDDYDEMKEHLT